jgi:hypothetical protein
VSGLILSVPFSLDGKTLASSSLDHIVRLWHVATRRPIGVRGGDTSPTGLDYSTTAARPTRSAIGAPIGAGGSRVHCCSLGVEGARLSQRLRHEFAAELLRGLPAHADQHAPEVPVMSPRRDAPRPAQIREVRNSLTHAQVGQYRQGRPAGIEPE